MHFWDPRETIPSEFSRGYLAEWEGITVNHEEIDDVVDFITTVTGCRKAVLPVGNVVDNSGLYHYMFVVAPSDVGRFASARTDSRWSGEIKWYGDVSRDDLPEEFIEFANTMI